MVHPSCHLRGVEVALDDTKEDHHYRPVLAVVVNYSKPFIVSRAAFDFPLVEGVE